MVPSTRMLRATSALIIAGSGVLALASQATADAGASGVPVVAALPEYVDLVVTDNVASRDQTVTLAATDTSARGRVVRFAGGDGSVVTVELRSQPSVTGGLVVPAGVLVTTTAPRTVGAEVAALTVTGATPILPAGAERNADFGGVQVTMSGGDAVRVVFPSDRPAATVPASPESVTSTVPVPGRENVNWVAGANGGAPLIGFEVKDERGRIVCHTATTTCTDVAAEGPVNVRALSTVGQSAWSAAAVVQPASPTASQSSSAAATASAQDVYTTATEALAVQMGIAAQQVSPAAADTTVPTVEPTITVDPFASTDPFAASATVDPYAYATTADPFAAAATTAYTPASTATASPLASTGGSLDWARWGVVAVVVGAGLVWLGAGPWPSRRAARAAHAAGRGRR